MRRPSDDPAVKISFSLPSSLNARMMERLRSLHNMKASAYIQALILKDVTQRGPLIHLPVEEIDTGRGLRVAEDPPPPNPKKAQARRASGTE